MLASLSLELDGDINPRDFLQKASLFHGVLMDHINSEYAEALHQNGLKPYSQHLSYDGQTYRWVLHALNEEAYQKILLPFFDEEMRQISLNHNHLTLSIKGRQMIKTTYQALIDTYYLGLCPRYIPISFCTPTAFKQNGNYVFFPDLRLIYQSLMLRFDAFAENESIYLEETLEQLADYTEVNRYNLHSLSYPLEGVRIPSFMGNVLLKVKGPQPLVNLANLLFRYGGFSGIGIKTAMGMGGIRIDERRKKSD